MRKPRNFAAMREDRVLAMAQAAFGREFGSKKVAIEALARLPVDKQHALKKPASGSGSRPASDASPERQPKRSFEHMKRGGVAPAPSAIKLVDASEASVRRLATATTGIPAKSKAQALTLLAKYGSTDIAKEAGRALGTSDVLRDNRLAKMSAPKQMPVRAVAPVAPLPQPPSPLSAPAGGNAFAIPRPMLQVAGTAALAGGAAVMAGAAYQDARAKGESQGQAVIEGAKAGLVPGALAVAQTFSQVAMRATMPVLAGYGAFVGAREDANAMRGAARGAIRALDPSTLATAFMADKRSFGERAFDRTFGAAQPRTGTGAYIDPAAAKMDAASASQATPAPRRQYAASAPTYKDTWTDKRGRQYERHDLSVRTAA